ncbi:Uncharacterised protein [Mycobacterium tuberculosis]|nr:Uncharacterised protein [Mycobacterium tuberculosis]
MKTVWVVVNRPIAPLEEYTSNLLMAPVSE